MAENQVELLGFYGGDESHALSAWTSTARELTDDKKGRIGAMLRMLAERGHHTPFEKSYLHFLVTCDTASHIHLLKHRIGVSVNAESARYKELRDDKFYVPDDWPAMMQITLRSASEKASNQYHAALTALEKGGIPRKRAKESARFFLPYATQVRIDVGFNFRSFMHFQTLRNHLDAQREIRLIAQQMTVLVRETHAFDLSLGAFANLVEA